MGAGAVAGVLLDLARGQAVCCVVCVGGWVGGVTRVCRACPSGRRALQESLSPGMYVLGERGKCVAVIRI